MIRATLTASLALLVAALLVAPASARRHHHLSPTPGTPGIGDRLFPTLGNGGYDARHYDLSLTYPSDAPLQAVSGELKMLARAKQSLSRFDLDFAGQSVTGVRVGHRRAGWTLGGGELVITPRHPIRDGHRFTVTVRFVSGPSGPTPGEIPLGWFTTNDGSVTAGQPDGSHTIYPVNDHPADKASYSIRLDVPQGITAVANGELRRRSTHAGRTRSVYEMREPMASELIQLAVGRLDVVQRGFVRGVRVRDVIPSSLAGSVGPVLGSTPAHLRWMTDRVGRYPFESYGVLAADRAFPYALETQTLSLFPGFYMLPAIPRSLIEPVMVHELAHQWFGDNVAPRRWSDLWLNEGHATWYEWLYGDAFFKAQAPDYEFVARTKQAYSHGDQWRALYGPVALPRYNTFVGLFSPNVYDGAETVLYALRQVIGGRAFAELERRWVDRNAGQSVGTEDFIELASRVSHRNLEPFLRDWLYGTDTPPMPGHPDWTVLPADTPLQAARASSARALEGALRHR